MSEKTITITITENEAGVLQNLLDGAVKHYGRQAAQAVAFFDQKIQEAAKLAASENKIKTGEQ